MMSSAKAEDVVFERSIEIYENERLWIGRGFSKQGLIPTERAPYSTEDGSLSWMTLPSASLALLRGEVYPGINGRESGSPRRRPPKTVRRGWSFHEEDREHENLHRLDNSDKANSRREDAYEIAGAHDSLCGFAPCVTARTDQDGWQYFPDFLPQSLISPNKKRGILDFVRRRKLRRVAVFRPDHFLPQDVYTKCYFCDSQVVDALSSEILDALSLATLFAHSLKSNLTDAQVIPIKSKLIDTLAIGSNCNNSDQSEDYDPLADIGKVKDRLTTFAEECVGKPGSLMNLFNADMERNFISAMPGRRKAMVKYLSDAERLNLARLLVRDIDRYSYKLHCRNVSCSSVMNGSFDGGDEKDDPEVCEFRAVPCPNEHCNSVISFKHMDEHDDECGYKVLPCPSGCGVEIPRQEVHIHVRDKCDMRQAECPLAMIGCTAIVQARDVPCHLRDHADKHFILMTNRMMEYQNVMKDMNLRIRQLEEKNVQLEKELKHTVSQLQSKKEAKATMNDVNKLTKRLGNLESTCRTEFKKADNDRKHG